MGYTEAQIIEKLNKGLENISTLYKAKIVNYRGKTSDTNKLYTEIIAEKIIEKIDVFEEIKTITRQRPYKVGHDGLIKSITNRGEEIFAKSLYDKEIEDLGKIIDYQIPLKNRQSDDSGKIDLLCKNGDKLIILELKTEDSKETLLRCVLEIVTYWHILDRDKLCKDFCQTCNTKIEMGILIGSNGDQQKEYLNNLQIQKLSKLLNVNVFTYNSDVKIVSNIKLCKSP